MIRFSRFLIITGIIVVLSACSFAKPKKEEIVPSGEVPILESAPEIPSAPTEFGASLRESFSSLRRFVPEEQISPTIQEWIEDVFPSGYASYWVRFGSSLSGQYVWDLSSQLDITRNFPDLFALRIVGSGGLTASGRDDIRIQKLDASYQRHETDMYILLDELLLWSGALELRDEEDRRLLQALKQKWFRFSHEELSMIKDFPASETLPFALLAVSADLKQHGTESMSGALQLLPFVQTWTVASLSGTQVYRFYFDPGIFRDILSRIHISHPTLFRSLGLPPPGDARYGFTGSGVYQVRDSDPTLFSFLFSLERDDSLLEGEVSTLSGVLSVWLRGQWGGVPFSHHIEVLEATGSLLSLSGSSFFEGDQGYRYDLSALLNLPNLELSGSIDRVRSESISPLASLKLLLSDRGGELAWALAQSGESTQGQLRYRYSDGILWSFDGSYSGAFLWQHIFRYNRDPSDDSFLFRIDRGPSPLVSVSGDWKSDGLVFQGKTALGSAFSFLYRDDRTGRYALKWISPWGNLISKADLTNNILEELSLNLRLPSGGLLLDLGKEWDHVRGPITVSDQAGEVFTGELMVRKKPKMIDLELMITPSQSWFIAPYSAFLSLSENIRPNIWVQLPRPKMTTDLHTFLADLDLSTPEERNAKRTVGLITVKSALQKYKEQYGKYPNTAPDGCLPEELLSAKILDWFPGDPKNEPTVGCSSRNGKNTFIYRRTTNLNGEEHFVVGAKFEWDAGNSVRDIASFTPEELFEFQKVLDASSRGPYYFIYY